MLIHLSFRPLLWGLLLILPELLWAQQPKSWERAQGYIQKAEEYYAKAQYEESLREYQFASQIYRQEQRTDLYGVCYNGVGNNYIELTRYADAYMEFSRVLHQYKEMRQVNPAFHPDSTIVADAYEGLGRFFMNAQENLINKRLSEQKAINFDTALYFHRQALDMRVKHWGKEHPKVALSYYFIAQCYGGMSLDTLRLQKDTSYRNPLTEQLRYLEEALRIQIATQGEQHHQTADIYDALGDYQYEVLRNYQKGMDYHQKSLQIRQAVFGAEHPKIAKSMVGIATYYRVLNLFDTELEYLENALVLRRKIFGEVHQDIAKNYFLLANRYRASGDMEKALTYYQQAFTIFTQLQGELSAEVADVYLQLALCYREMSEQRMERQFLDKALDIRSKIFGKQHVKIGEVYFEIGNFFLKYPHAVSNVQLKDSIFYYYGLANQIWTRQLGQDHQLFHQLLDNSAKAYYLLGDETAEIDFLKKALESKQLAKNQGNIASNRFVMTDAEELFNASDATTESTATNYQLFDSYLNLAKFYRRKKEYNTALVYAQNALESVAPSLGKAKGNLQQNPTIAELSNNLEWVEALQQKADLFRLTYLENGKQQKDIDFALKTYTLTLNLLDTLRNKFVSDASRQWLTVRSIPVYEGVIHTYSILYQLDKNLNHLEAAFKIAEQSKAFVLLQSLNTLRARGFGDVPGSVLIEEERLRQSIAYYTSAYNKGGKEAAFYQKHLFEKKRSYDSLMRVIETNYPKYHAMRHRNEVANLQVLREQLIDGKTVLLEYFLGDEHLYAFRITRRDQQFFQLPLPRNYQNLVHNLRRCLTDYDAIAQDAVGSYKTFVETAYTFYDKLVKPFLEGCDPQQTPNLILVPDGLLSYVPFDALVQEMPASLDHPNYKNLRYLITDYRINYAYSSTLLVENMNHGRIQNNGKCLGFAPTYEEATTTGAQVELPWAEKELQAIKSVFSGDYYFGNMATKDLFMSKSPNYAVIHLAMHGLADTRRPMNSKLAFYPVAGKQDDNSFLYAYEINNLKLNADLVVLSACQTGYGKALRGEGVVSLAWAFMYAGAPSIVTTLWEVNDFTSSTIMTNFYRNLDAGYEKPEALRRAKLDFLESSDQISGHPIFWSSFITIGDARPVTRGWAWWVWTLIGLGLATGSYLLYYYIQRKRNEHKRLDFDNSLHSDADAILSLLHRDENKQEPKAAETDETTIETEKEEGDK